MTPKDDVVPKTLLTRLLGEQLSAVIFVQDYVQLDFDGVRITLNIWPEIRREDRRTRFGDHGYRDDLCAFIGQKVTAVEDTTRSIEILFSTGAVAVDLSTERHCERVIVEDMETHEWGWW